MFRSIALAVAMIAFLAGCALAQDDKSFDVRSSVGDMHVGPDADAKALGLPLYPGARPKHEENSNPLNFGILTESFGMKLVVAKYESDDPPEKILNFYREKMKKYGKVLECRGSGNEHGARTDDDQPSSKPVKCEGDNSGPVRELKVGTEDNQRVVALEDSGSKKGTTFALVYVHTRGKQGEI